MSVTGLQQVAPEIQNAFAQKLIEVAPDRTLWGTDFPHPNIAGDMPNDGDLVDLLAEAAEDEAVRRQVLVDNPTRLYWAR